MTAFSYLFGDLRTGRISHEVPLIGTSWSSPLNDSGEFAGTAVLSDPDVAALRMRHVAAVARTFVAVDFAGDLLYGGPIWAHKYSRKTRRLALASSGLWSIFDHRKIIPALQVANPADEAPDTVLTALTLQGIARRVMAQALAHPGGDLPIVWDDGTPITTPRGSEAGGNERTFRGYELPWVGDELRKLTEVQNGPDITLTPRRRPGAPEFVEWVLRMGNPSLAQAGDPWVLDADDVVDIEVDHRGTGLGSRAWITGEGQARDLPMTHADDFALVTQAGYPLTEVEEAHRSASRADTLQEHAVSLAAARSRPAETWTVTVRTDAELAPSTYSEGDWFLLPVSGDPYIPDGTYRVRLLAIGGNQTHVELTMYPEKAVV